MAALGISLYPEFMEPAALRTYVQQARALGYDRVFLSLILSRLNFHGAASPDSAVFDQAFACCKEHGMRLTADVDDQMLAAADGVEAAVRRLQSRGIDCLRVDSGLSPALIAAILQAGMHIELNAADVDVLTPAGLAGAEALLSGLLEQGTPENIRACFNFYPRTGTGLSLESVRHTTAFLHRCGITVAAFVASQTAQPVLHRPGHGVCTVEALRETPPEVAAAMLRFEGVDEIWFGDLCASPAELRAVGDVCRAQGVRLPVVYNRDCPEELRRLLGEIPLSNRTDTPERVIRGTQSRGLSVVPARCNARPRYCVTLDNVRSDQYMGEAQIMLQDMPPCPEANVVGWILPDYQPLVEYLRESSRTFYLCEWTPQ